MGFYASCATFFRANVGHEVSGLRSTLRIYDFGTVRGDTEPMSRSLDYAATRADPGKQVRQSNPST